MSERLADLDISENDVVVRWLLTLLVFGLLTCLLLAPVFKTDTCLLISWTLGRRNHFLLFFHGQLELFQLHLPFDFNQLSFFLHQFEPSLSILLLRILHFIKQFIILSFNGVWVIRVIPFVSLVASECRLKRLFQSLWLFDWGLV